MQPIPQRAQVGSLDRQAKPCPIAVGRWVSIQRELGLTNRELDIVQCFFGGMQEFEVASSLGISTHTVHTHLGRIYRKLSVRSYPAMLLRVFATYIATDSGPESAEAVRPCRGETPD